MIVFGDTPFLNSGPVFVLRRGAPFVVVENGLWNPTPIGCWFNEYMCDEGCTIGKLTSDVLKLLETKLSLPLPGALPGELVSPFIRRYSYGPGPPFVRSTIPSISSKFVSSSSSGSFVGSGGGPGDFGRLLRLTFLGVGGGGEACIGKNDDDGVGEGRGGTGW